MDKALIADMLASIQRLNEECQSRVNFERKLMEVIQQKDNAYTEQTASMLTLRSEFGDLSKKYAELGAEHDILKETVIEFLRSKGYALCWNYKDKDGEVKLTIEKL